MFTQHEISMEEHQAWFARTRNDPRTRWFLYLDKNSQPMGVVYFTQIDREQKTAFWGFYASPDATLGTGIRMSSQAIDKAFADLGIYRLNADVLSSNSRSFEMHKSVGFIEEGRFREQFFNGQERVDVIRLGFLAIDWQQKREALQKRISELDALAARGDSTRAGGGGA
jgi:UDP-4-amino-4,6-dideoxy-N-acetyl-beta-L-altrosamine N-acetyltransferase